MKVLHISYSYDLTDGGITTVVNQLIKEQRKTNVMNQKRWRNTTFNSTAQLSFSLKIFLLLYSILFSVSVDRSGGLR